MCMTACQATAGTSEENHVPDTSTAAQENADNQVTKDETSGRTIVVYYSWSENTKSIAKRIAETTGADIYEIRKRGFIKQRVQDAGNRTWHMDAG